jgi:ferredoxin-NADP reductase
VPNTGLARRFLTSRVVTALAEPHGVDRYLNLVNPVWSVREVRARVLAVARRTPDTVTMTLRPNGLWTGAKAGQYVRFGVDIDGVRRIRCFSLASAAGADPIEITAKVRPGGTVTRWLATHARPGLLVHLSQAEGDFTLPEPLGGHVLLISGGSGITPVMSIARTLRCLRYPGLVTFLHYSRTPADIVYRPELAELARSWPAFTVTCRYTGRGGRNAHFHAQHLRAAAPDYADAYTFVCGPPTLLDAVRGHWADEGISERLRVERFTVASAPFRGDAGEVAGELWFSRSGIRVPGDGRTLLEQAEAAGLHPAFGCRMGICHTCGSHKHEGPVRDVRTGVTSAEPDEQVRLCVNAPAGDVEIAI